MDDKKFYPYSYCYIGFTHLALEYNKNGYGEHVKKTTTKPG